MVQVSPTVLGCMVKNCSPRLWMNVRGVIQDPAQGWIIHADLTISITLPKMAEPHCSIFFIMFIFLKGVVLSQKFGTSSLIST